MNLWNGTLWLAMVLLAVGGVNWGLVGLFEFDLVARIFGEEFGTTNTITRVVYALVGGSAILSLIGLPAVQMRAARSQTGAERLS